MLAGVLGTASNLAQSSARCEDEGARSTQPEGADEISISVTLTGLTH